MGLSLLKWSFGNGWVYHHSHGPHITVAPLVVVSLQGICKILRCWAGDPVVVQSLLSHHSEHKRWWIRGTLQQMLRSEPNFDILRLWETIVQTMSGSITKEGLSSLSNQELSSTYISTANNGWLSKRHGFAVMFTQWHLHSDTDELDIVVWTNYRTVPEDCTLVIPKSHLPNLWSYFC